MGTYASTKLQDTKTPQILSTHPSPQTRVSNLRKNAPQALAQVQQIKASLNQ